MVSNRVEFEAIYYPFGHRPVYSAFHMVQIEYFGMGQDQGVYQTHAIALINGYNDLQLDFKEYDTLEPQEEKDCFKKMLQTQLIGLYNYDPELPFASQEAEKSDVSAVFHGVPTFASVLALWGSMFGISHMAGIQTLFFSMCYFSAKLLSGSAEN